MPMRANSLLQELTSTEKGGKNESGRVVTPAIILIHLKVLKVAYYEIHVVII